MIQNWKTAINDRGYKETISVPADMIGCIFGQNGSNIKRNRVNVYVSLKKGR